MPHDHPPLDRPLDHPLDRRRALGLAGAALLGGAAAGPLLAGRAEAATAWTSFAVVTANLGRVADKADHGRYETSVRNVRRTVKIATRTTRPLVGFQEIGEGDKDPLIEHRLIAKYFEGFKKAFFTPSKHPSYRVPIIVPAPFEVVSTNAVRGHGGVENVSPPRWISEVVLRLGTDPKTRFAMLNTHYIAGAYNGDQHQDRRKYWDALFKLHQERIAHYHAKGLPVIWTGDVNRRNLGRLHPLERRLMPADSIDQVRWIPGTNGTQLRFVRRQTIDLTIEAVHDAHAAVMQVRRA